MSSQWNGCPCPTGSIVISKTEFHSHIKDQTLVEIVFKRESGRPKDEWFRLFNFFVELFIVINFFSGECSENHSCPKNSKIPEEN